MEADHDEANDEVFPAIPHADFGLADRSEELDELSEKDIRIRFYQKMASIDEDRPGLVQRMCGAIASVMYDFCAIHLRTREGDVDLAAAFDANETLRAEIREMIAVGGVIPASALHRASRSGLTTFTPQAAGTVAFAHPDDPEVRIRVHSVIVCPLKTTRGELFGALTVGRHATSRPYDAADRALLEWIASHVSMKLETARLHRDLKKTNRQLQEKADELAAAVRVRDIFLATASHELKTPLSTLSLQVELLRRRLESEPQAVAARVDGNVRALERQVDRLNRLVAQLLDVSLLREGRLDLVEEHVDLHEIACEVASRFQPEASRRGLQIVVDGEPTDGMWDPSRIDQVISNLVSNAIKYSERGVIQIDVSGDDENGSLTVEDEGIGIAPEALERVFGRFERGPDVAGADGLGLGLWIVHQITEQIGGRVDVSSEVDVGTCFRVTFPRGRRFTETDSLHQVSR